MKRNNTVPTFRELGCQHVDTSANRYLKYSGTHAITERMC